MLKKLSKRAIFKQLLLNDVLNMIDSKYNGTHVYLADLREDFRGENSLFNKNKYGLLAGKFYYEMYSKNWTFTSWDDRWYRAMQSINNGTDLTIKKVDGKLVAFKVKDSFLGKNFKVALMDLGADDWVADYNRH
jgi:hypothetical protein